MSSELKRPDHPMLAVVLTVSMSSLAQAATEPPSVNVEPGLTEELELMKEEETVSIASRYEQPISQAPSNVYVITDEDIRNSGAIDLPTVLRMVPGLEIMQMTAADFNVSVRGDNQPLANKLLVMVDGRSIYVDVQGTLFWKAIPVTLPEIKRIEVLKGPASAIYGFNAFDGIINIITKSAEEMKGTTVQFGAGELGTISSAAIHAGTIGQLGYRLSAGRDQTQQWGNRDALGFRAHKFNIQTDYALSAVSRLQVSGGLTDVNRFDGPVGEVVHNSISPSLGYANVLFEHGSFVIHAWWSGYSDTSVVTPVPQLANFLRITDRNGSNSNPFFGNTYNFDVRHTAELGAFNRLIYGLNYRHNSLSSSATDAFSREDRMGLFVQDEWHPAQPLTLIAGVRYDLDTFIDPTVSPRAAVIYQPFPDHTFRASVSVAYRPPTLFETHQDQRVVTTVPTGLPPPFPPSFSTTTAVRGSTRLAPEQIVSYELGYQGWFLKHRLRIRTDLFFNHISDLITSRNTSPGQATFVNDPGAADIYGGEAGMEFLVTRWLSGFANYSYQEIGQSIVGTAQRAGPRFKWNAGLRAEWDNGVNGELVYNHVGAVTYPVAATFTALAPFGATVPPSRVGSYNLLNLRGGYRFWKQKAAAGYLRDAEVAVSAFNALNDKHKEHPLGDTIGSRVMGWLTVRF